MNFLLKLINIIKLIKETHICIAATTSLHCIEYGRIKSFINGMIWNLYTTCLCVFRRLCEIFVEIDKHYQAFIREPRLRRYDQNHEKRNILHCIEYGRIKSFVNGVIWNLYTTCSCVFCRLCEIFVEIDKHYQAVIREPRLRRYNKK